jgi:nucleotidyltransferase substrate binding protein (TIGR01987 family)
MIDCEKYAKSLEHLKSQYANFLSLDDRGAVLPLDREAVSESVIQRFEVCYDCAWKTLKRYLSVELGLPDLPNSPKPVLRIAFENGLFENIEAWLAYANARTGTSHDYSGGKAQNALGLMGRFIEDASALYCRIAGDKPQ